MEKKKKETVTQLEQEDDDGSTTKYTWETSLWKESSSSLEL